MKTQTQPNTAERFQHCSICKIPRTQTSLLVSGKDACICPSCALGIHRVLLEHTDYPKGSFDPEVQNTWKLFSSVKSSLLITTTVLAVILYFILKK